MSKVIKLSEKFALFNDLWTPKILAEFNGQHLKIAKVKGDFVWHDHANEDELFLVIKGSLSIAFRDETIELQEGELFVVPKGVEHKPFAKEACHLLLIEPASIKHTGEIEHKLTRNKPDYI